MPRRILRPKRHRTADRRTFAALAVLLAATVVQAADPQPYTVEIAATGQAPLDEALQDSSTLLALRDTAPVGPFALIARARQDLESFLVALRSFGYYQAQVRITVAGRLLDDATLVEQLSRAPTSPPAPIAIHIDPGAQFRLGRIEFHGALPDELREHVGLKPGDPAVATDVLDARERLVEALHAHGYARAEVSPPVGELNEANKTLDLRFDVDTGPVIALGAVDIKGTNRLDETFVRNRLTIGPGDRFDPESIEKSRQDLASLGVFSSVRVRAADELDTHGRLPIEFELTERDRRAVSVSGAFSTDLGGSLNLSWKHRNLFGQAEQLNVSAGVTQLGGNSTIGVGYNAGATFLKPDFLIRDQSLQTDLLALKQSLNAYDQKAVSTGVLINRRFTPEWAGSAGLTAEQEQITQQGLTADYTLLGLPITARYDDTESLLDPTRGIRATFSATPMQPLVGPTQTPFVNLQASASTYFDLADPGRSVLALRGLIGVIEGAGQFDIPADKRFYAGGSATVRGYRFQAVGPQFPDNRPQGGTAIFAASAEFRQRFLEDYGVAVFLDAGEVTANGPPFTGDWRFGTGLGARYYTSIGPIRVDVAVPINRVPGSGSFELYVGLGQAF